ncbi:MAG: SRPBCC domain-containing protein [Acidimicrobiales bacterium]
MGARSYQVTRTIHASPDTVWRLLTNADTYSEWNKAVIDIQGPIRTGDRIRLISVADPKRTFKLEVSEMDAPTRMVWCDGMPFGLFTGRRTYTIIGDGPDRSEFAMIEEFSGPLAPLITKAIPDLTESFELFADSLKTAAEARGSR